MYDVILLQKMVEVLGIVLQVILNT